MLGPTLDYAHRILATEVLSGETHVPAPVEPAATPSPAKQPSVAAWQAENGLLTAPVTDRTLGNDIPDVTREPLLFPAKRAHTLQSLARAETGGVLALGYAAQRGYGQAHPTVNELRLAEAEIVVTHPRGTRFSAGRVKVSQAEVVSKKGAELGLGFAATLGWNEVKVIAAATLDVFHPEPLPADHPFWAHPKINITPHAASLTTPETAALAVAENIRRIGAGQAPEPIVDVEAGY